MDTATGATHVTENRLEKQNSTEESAILIQKIWRGYNTRKMNKCIADTLQRSRTQQHIEYDPLNFRGAKHFLLRELYSYNCAVVQFLANCHKTWRPPKLHWKTSERSSSCKCKRSTRFGKKCLRCSQPQRRNQHRHPSFRPTTIRRPSSKIWPKLVRF